MGQPATDSKTWMCFHRPPDRGIPLQMIVDINHNLTKNTNVTVSDDLLEDRNEFSLVERIEVISRALKRKIDDMIVDSEERWKEGGEFQDQGDNVEN
jgi:hypothetical protein